MKILTFSGATPAEALRRAQEDVGEEAMLIETRELQKKSLGKSALYEIVVGIEEHLYKPKKRQHQAAPNRETPLQKKSNDVLFNISEAAKQISQIAEVTEGADAQEPKESAHDIKLIKDEISKLTDKVQLIQHMFWEEKSPHMAVSIPSEFAEIYKLSLQSGMKQEHLDEIMRLSLEHMPSKMRENSQSVKRYFQTLLRKMVPVRLESVPNNRSKKVMMLVGPTGVGKTTSIAKLAARYSYLMEKN